MPGVDQEVDDQATLGGGQGAVPHPRDQRVAQPRLRDEQGGSPATGRSGSRDRPRRREAVDPRHHSLGGQVADAHPQHLRLDLGLDRRLVHH
jgi:hypothetical protein